MKITRAAVAAVAGVGLVMALVSPASAGKPEQEREHVVFVDEDVDVCGITVDVFVDVHFFDKVFFDSDGNVVRFLGNASGSNIFVNDAGEQVVVTFANLVRETESVDVTANTITFTTSVRGLPEKITAGHGGPVITRDAGLITFVTTFDLTTEEEISSEVVVNNGPHPQADSDFTLFCEIITDELG
jgi:hypothetical protein